MINTRILVHEFDYVTPGTLQEALQLVAVRYEGQQHFILFDNIATLLRFFEEKHVVRFFKEQGRRMAGLGIFGIYLVPEGAVALNWLDSLKRFNWR